MGRKLEGYEAGMKLLPQSLERSGCHWASR